MTKEKRTKTSISKIISVLLIILVVCMLAIALFFTYNRINGKSVSFFGYSVYYVVTPSMEPTLNVGDVILVKKTPEGNIKKGDIITFKSTSGEMCGKIITHRVHEKIEVSEGVFQFKTKGDAATSVDEAAVNYSNILGVYSNKMYITQFIISALSNIWVFLLLVILPLFIVFIMQVTSFINTIKLERDKNKS